MKPHPNGANGNNAVFRDTVKTIPIGFRRTPTDVVDDGNTILAKPVTKCTHTVCIIQFDRLRKILIG